LELVETKRPLIEYHYWSAGNDHDEKRLPIKRPLNDVAKALESSQRSVLVDASAGAKFVIEMVKAHCPFDVQINHLLAVQAHHSR